MFGSGRRLYRKIKQLKYFVNIFFSNFSVHFFSSYGKTGITFGTPLVSAKVYQNDCLERVVKPLNQTLFNGMPWIFQQDSAPAHKAKTTQKWLAENVPDFIRASDWPSGSPDLNALDYELWNTLEEIACQKPHRNLESLKRSIVEAASKIPIEKVRTCIEQWPERMRQCIENEDGHFE